MVQCARLGRRTVSGRPQDCACQGLCPYCACQGRRTAGTILQYCDGRPQDCKSECQKYAQTIHPQVLHVTTRSAPRRRLDCTTMDQLPATIHPQVIHGTSHDPQVIHCARVKNVAVPSRHCCFMGVTRH